MRDKFITFLESVKTSESESLINTIMEGFEALSSTEPQMEVIAIASNGQRKKFNNYKQANDIITDKLGYTDTYPSEPKDWVRGGDSKIPVVFTKDSTQLTIKVYPSYVIEDGLV